LRCPNPRPLAYRDLVEVTIDPQLFDEFSIACARRFGQDLESLAFGGEKSVRQGFIIDLSEMGVDVRLRGLVTCEGVRDWRCAGLRFSCHLIPLFRPNARSSETSRRTRAAFIVSTITSRYSTLSSQREPVSSRMSASMNSRTAFPASA